MLEQFFEGHDVSYTPFFLGCWSDWEDSAWIVLFEKEGKHYCLESTNDEVKFDQDLVAITEDEALHLMEEWGPYEEEVCYW